MKDSNMSIETMDPTDWDGITALGQRMVADMIEHAKTVRERPAWQSLPKATKHALDMELPRTGASLEDVYQDFCEHILPFPTGNTHPGFWGWVMANGSPTAMLADMLASGMNPHLAGYDQSAAEIERQVLGWMKALMGYPEEASGLLVSGGTMANLNGLTIARNEKSGIDLREEGLQAASLPKLTVYGSEQTHSWILKACELMGLGRKAFRAVPVKDDYSVNLDAMRASIERDIANGCRPFCIVGTLGTVNTGALDDVMGLREIADVFDLWLHIDGAFGSVAALAPDAPDQVRAQQHADSIAFDLHKWGYLPYEVGCILVRQSGAPEATFSANPSYLSNTSRGPSADTTYFADKGIQLSRGFRALKVWMTYREQGFDKVGRIISQNMAQARHLGETVERCADLELLAPVTLNTVCFRHCHSDQSGDAADELNKEILLRLQESGRFVPSHTILERKFAIRVCITNHRTQITDLDALIKDTLQHAEDILAKRSYQPLFRPLLVNA